MTIVIRARTLTTALALTLLLGLLAVAPASGQITSTPTGDVQNVSGQDPVETALAYSALLPDGGSANALIGTTGAFADSLASGALQGHLNAPLLLTDTDDLDDRVVAELQRLGVTTVVILGGTAAISAAVEQELGTLASTVTRASGSTRLGTAIAIADLVTPNSDPGTVIIARAFGEGSAAFADALAAGAAAAHTTYPILLTPTEALDSDVAAWLSANNVRTGIIAGGVAAVSQATQDAISALGITTQRLSGGSRVTTAIAITTQLADIGQPMTVVAGEGDLAWASGFAAALSSPGGVLLTTGDVAPADTLTTLFGTDQVRCGATLSPDLCGQVTSAASVPGDQPAPLAAVLDGDQEVPAVDAGSSGRAFINPAGPESVCLTVNAFGLTGPITASHIHEASFGDSGSPVIPFSLSPSELSPGFMTACPAAAEMGALSRLFDSPGDFYVNLHTEANPGGEVRGQVFEIQGLSTADLTGAHEVPGPGHPTAMGNAQVWDTGVADELCYVVDQGDLSPRGSAAHIHRGTADVSGDVVVPLGIGAGGQTFAHCDRDLDPGLVTEITDNPNGFYVNVHNEDFPAGAIRGNLFVQSRD